MRAPCFALFVAAACAVPTAHAQVRRCVTPEGATVFTDRRCEDIGSVERAEPERPYPGATYRGGCARTLRDLVFELDTAITARDANRLASIYHWPGMSTREGYAVVARLDAIARRPLVDIVPIMPAAPDGASGGLHPRTSVRRAPVGLRVEQTLANGITPSRAVFGLRRHFGCWWISG